MKHIKILNTVCLSLTLATLFGLTTFSSYGYERVLFYETFEEQDTRNGGYIFPEGTKQIRIGGRPFFTELEIEAPTDENETRPLARFVPDPTGLSLSLLQLEDQDRDPGDGSFSAEGGVSLLEPILLDQGDRSGRAVASWMAIPFQDDEVGGSMFPETDTAIDAGPEGLNLIGFGGVQRDFDTGDPIPGQDFSGELIMNQKGGSNLTPIGVGYSPNLPTFIVLVFDLDESLYDMYINGVLVQEDLPFFDMAGETGKTLRELELISSARGVGTFAYDNVFQFDPDQPYTPIDFRFPVIAENADLIPLFMENFDDNELGPLSGLQDGDLFGTNITYNGAIEIEEDASFQTLTRARMSEDSALDIQFHQNYNTNNPLRLSFTVTPNVDSSLIIQAGETSFVSLTAGDMLSTANEEGDLVPTSTPVITNLPHRLTLTMDHDAQSFTVQVYRAQSVDNAQTVVFEESGSISNDSPFHSFTFHTTSGELWFDDLLLVEINESPSGDQENRYQALVHETFEQVSLGENSQYTEQVSNVVEDPSGWSFRSLENPTESPLTLFENENIRRSARIDWSVLPEQAQESSVLHVTFDSGETRTIAGLLPNQVVGVDTNGDGALEPTSSTYQLSKRNEFSVNFDLIKATYTIYVNGNKVAKAPLLEDQYNLTLTQASLHGTPGGTIYFDDLLVVQNQDAALFDPHAFEAPLTNEGQTLLFEENFENNPARSEQVIDELEPQVSGLPIPAKSNGFSDKAETDLPNTYLTIGAPSAEAAYIEDPDGSSLYSLYIHDRFSPQAFEGFESALPFTPISTLRTTPFAFVIPELAQSLTEDYVVLRWSAQALQSDQTGMALFLDVNEAEIPVAKTTISVPAPSGTPVVAFGEEGSLLADQNGDGNLESLDLTYSTSRAHRFMVIIDRNANTYDLYVDEELIFEAAPLNDSAQEEQFLQRLGWFTTLVGDGDGNALQQSATGGGAYIMDNIRIFQSTTSTAIHDFALY